MADLRRLIPVESAVATAYQVVQMATSLVVLRWITPEQNGVWQTMLVLESYLLAVRLGVPNAMNRHYPFLLGAGEQERAVAVVRSAHAYTLVACAAELVGLVVAWFLLPAGFGWQLALVAFAFYAPATLYRGYLEATFRGGRDFARLARVQLWLIVACVVTVPWVVWWGFPGYLARAAALAVAGIVLLHRERPVRVGPRWDRSIVLMLLVTGLPLFVANYGSGVAATFPRLWLLAEGGERQLGLFTPVAALISLGSLVPSVIGVYLLPRLNHDLGGSGDARGTARDSLRASAWSAALLAPFLGLAWFILPWAMELLLPAYVAAVPAMRWALLLVLVGCFRVATMTFSVLQAWKPMFVHLAVVMLTSFVAPWWVLELTALGPVESVTVGLVAAGVLQLAVGFWCVRWAVRAYSSATAPVKAAA